MTLQQSTAERIISFVAEHTGLCWLSPVLWWGGVMGGGMSRSIDASTVTIAGKIWRWSHEL